MRSGYITYILRSYAVKFLQEAFTQKKPFLLFFTPNAPHYPADPAPGDENLYNNLPDHRPISFNEDDISDKPGWLQKIKKLTHEDIENVHDLRRKQLQSLNALDEAIESILKELEKQQRLDNTVIFYCSDNGLFWGEHRLTEKIFAYEEAGRMPFAVRYSKTISVPRIDTNLVGNIDIAPTIYELAGISAPADIDGHSLVSLLKEKNSIHDFLLIAGKGQEKAGQMRNQKKRPIDGTRKRHRTKPPVIRYSAIHTGRYVYIETDKDTFELYDLENDPYEIQNEINNPEYTGIIKDLQQKLAAILGMKILTNKSPAVNK